MKKRSKILIVFVFLGVIRLLFVFAIIIWITYIVHINNKVKSIMSRIDESYDFVYYNDYDFYYKGERHYFGHFLEKNDYNFDIEYISHDYLIYSKHNNKRYDYYLMNGSGDIMLIYSSQFDYHIDALSNNILYFRYKDDNIIYDLITKEEKKISVEEYYLKAFETKYILKYDQSLTINNIFITDTYSNETKEISIEKLLDNELIYNLYIERKKISLNPLDIKSIWLYKNNIYISISPENINGITIKYEFDSGTIEIVNRFSWKYLEHLHFCYIGNADCEPIEYLLNNQK